MWLRIVVLLAVASAIKAQFPLPQSTQRGNAKPLVKPELEDYFSINPGSDFVQSFLGGYIPPPNYEVQKQSLKLGPLPGLSIQRVPGSSGGAGGGTLLGPNVNLGSLASLLNPPPAGSPSGGPPGSFASLLTGGGSPPGLRTPLDTPPTRSDSALFGLRQKPSGNVSSSSSISGIPEIFPNLPRPPIPSSPNIPSLPQARGFSDTVPQSASSPWSSGGIPPPTPGTSAFGNLGSLIGSLTGASPTGFPPSNAAQSAAAAGFSSQNLQSLLGGSNIRGPPNPLSIQQNIPPSPFSSGSSSSLAGNSISQFPQQQPLPVPGPVEDSNPFSLILKSLGLNNLSPQLDLSGISGLLGGTGGQQVASQGVLSSVLYNALTDNAIQTISVNGTDKKQLNLTKAASGLIDRGNAAVLQNLLSQPSSPLCNPKPQAVKKFQLDAFMGKWFQVLYSPPMSLGPCSMITYSKLSDIGNGGPGTVFNLFEYTTEGTPHGSPRISSGYAIVRDTGEMIYRTSSNPTDLNVYVIETGPINSQGLYDYAILGVNCNYPIYVFARDPMDYKQKYEQKVSSDLDRKGLATSWSRLLNVVAPVDYNLCNFPPTLFNVQG